MVRCVLVCAVMRCVLVCGVVQCVLWCVLWRNLWCGVELTPIIIHICLLATHIKDALKDQQC